MRPAALAGWRDGSSKRALIGFVDRVPHGSAAVALAERIAAFDNDGTLCWEKPTTAFAAFLAGQPSSGDRERVAERDGP